MVAAAASFPRLVVDEHVLAGLGMMQPAVGLAGEPVDQEIIEEQFAAIADRPGDVAPSAGAVQVRPPPDAATTAAPVARVMIARRVIVRFPGGGIASVSSWVPGGRKAGRGGVSVRLFRGLGLGDFRLDRVSPSL